MQITPKEQFAGMIILTRILWRIPQDADYVLSYRLIDKLRKEIAHDILGESESKAAFGLELGAIFSVHSSNVVENLIHAQQMKRGT